MSTVDTDHTLSPEQTRTLLYHVAKLGYLETINRLNNELRPRGRRQNDPWRRDQVIKAFELKIITRVEARRLLRIRTTRQK